MESISSSPRTRAEADQEWTAYNRSRATGAYRANRLASLTASTTAQPVGVPVERAIAPSSPAVAATSQAMPRIAEPSPSGVAPIASSSKAPPERPREAARSPQSPAPVERPTRDEAALRPTKPVGVAPNRSMQAATQKVDSPRQPPFLAPEAPARACRRPCVAFVGITVVTSSAAAAAMYAATLLLP